MKLAQLIPVCSDLSEVAVEEAWNQAGKPEFFSLIVGTEHVSSARTVKVQGKKPHIWVNPDWSGHWMLSSKYTSVFSEGV